MAVTNTYNEFLKAELESEKTQSQIKKLQDWLTGQTQLQQQQCDEHEHEHCFPPPHSNIVMTAKITICAAWNRKI